MPTGAVAALGRLGGIVGELVRLGQAAHHVLQPGADNGVVALALPVRLVGGVSGAGLWSSGGRLLLALAEGRLRELKVGLGEGVWQRAAGLRRRVHGHGGRLSSVPSQDLLLHALRLIRGRRFGCRVSTLLLQSQRFARTRHRYDPAPASGGAGQTRGVCRFACGDLWRGGDRGFEEQRRVQAVVWDPWEPASVDRRRLGVQDAELLVEFLCYLTGKLNKVAAVEFPISPVEPAQDGKLTTSMTLVELLELGIAALACVCV